MAPAFTDDFTLHIDGSLSMKRTGNNPAAQK
jgi:hypothetical protein